MKPAICLEWQTTQMSAPSFWYYTPDNQAILNQDLRALHRPGTRIEVRVCEVPDQTVLFPKPNEWRVE